MRRDRDSFLSWALGEGRIDLIADCPFPRSAANIVIHATTYMNHEPLQLYRPVSHVGDVSAAITLIISVGFTEGSHMLHCFLVIDHSVAAPQLAASRTTSHCAPLTHSTGRT